MKKKNGFTLIELLSVIVILAIIMAIAIPSVTKTLRGAQKDSFYLYAQNLQSKAISQYTQDLEHNKKNTDCAVYDIDKDLNLSDTGKYEGWVKVLREAAESGKRSLNIPITNNNGILYVKYCVSTSNCTPSESVFIEENTKSTSVSRTLEKGEKLCIQYEYPDKDTNVVKKSSINCYDYNDGTPSKDTYKYSVIMTLKDDNYAVENVLFNDNMSSDIFNDKIKEFQQNHKNDTNKLAISSPVCSKDEEVSYRGVTTTKTTLVSTTTSEGNKTSIVTTSNNTDKTQMVTTSTTQTVSVTNVTTTTTSKEDTTTLVNTTTTTSTTTQTTTTTTTPTIDINDRSLLLASLSVSGYDEYLEFSPYKFSYSLNVPNNVTSVSVNATLQDSNSSTLEISGNDNLQVGNNPVVVTVKNKTTEKVSYYRINIRRLGIGGQVITNPQTTTTKKIGDDQGLPDPTIDSSNASLQNINISGYNIDFDPNVYEYTITTQGEKQLFIDYQAQVPNSVVSMNGNNDLVNDSVITINVQSENGYYHKDYKIQVKVKKKSSQSTLILRGAVIVGALILSIVAIVISKKKGKKVNSPR